MKLIREILFWVAIIFAVIFLSFVFTILLTFLFKNIINNNAIALRIFTYHLSIILSLACIGIPYRLFKSLPLFPDWCFSRNIKHYGIAIFGTAVIFTFYFFVAKYYGVKEDWVADLISGDTLTLIFAFFAILILAPISEEVTIRWWGIYILRKIQVPSFWAVFVTSGIFALLHTQYGLITIAYLFVLACWFGFLRLYTNSISVPVVAHMFAGLSGSLTVFF